MDQSLVVAQSQEISVAPDLGDFNPNEHIIQIKNKGGMSDYLPVQWRLVWFRKLCPAGTIDTEPVTIDLDRETEEETSVWNSETRRSEKIIKRANGYALFKAVVTDGRGGRSTGYKSEKAASFGDFIEKAETGAIGRALAGLGYGTQFAPLELDEEHRIVDAPVERKPLSSIRPTANNGKPYEQRRSFVEAGPATQEDALATEQQIASIKKLCQHLGKTEPEQMESLGYLAAKEMISQLSLEYRQSRKQEPAEPQEPASPVPDAPMPAQLRARHKELGLQMSFEQIVEKCFNRVIADDELTPTQCVYLSKVYDRKASEKATTGDGGGH